MRAEMQERLRADYHARRPVAGTAGQPITTVADWAEWWLVTKKNRGRKASVIDRYARELAIHILPVLGHIELANLRREDLEAFAADCEQAKKPNGKVYAIPTVKGWWSTLVSMLLDAHAAGYLPFDVTKRVNSPEWQDEHRERGPVREQRTLSAPQVREVLEIVKEKHPSRYAEVATVALTGARIGEVYALTWDKVDLDNGILKVDASVWRGEVGTTKTGVGRVTALPQEVADILTIHRADLEQDNPRGFASGIVFPSTKGTHRTQSSLTKVFKTVMNEASHDIRVNCQVLRRSWNTLLRQAEVHGNVIQAMMGHADKRMTKLYDGVPIEDKHEAVRRVSEDIVRGLSSG